MMSIYTVLNLIWKIFFGVGFIVIVALVGYKLNEKRKYKYFVEVYDQDSLGNQVVYMDKMAKLVDRRTNKEMGKFLKLKVQLGLENFNYQTIRSKKKYLKVVRVLRIAEDNFIFLTPSINAPEGSLELTTTREDTEWAINIFERVTRAFNTKNKFREMAGFTLVALGVIVVLIVVVLLIKQIPQILDTVSGAVARLETIATSQLQIQQMAGGIIV